MPGFPYHFGGYAPPPQSIPPYFSSMINEAKMENDLLNSELENLQTDKGEFGNIAQRAEDDIEKLKKSLLPSGLGIYSISHL